MIDQSSQKDSVEGPQGRMLLWPTASLLFAFLQGLIAPNESIRAKCCLEVYLNPHFRELSSEKRQRRPSYFCTGSQW